MTAVESRPAEARSTWRAVAIPSEHGGWGLTIEPVLLGLLVAPSIGGAALGASALLAFLVRTPLKLVAVDARRKRWLARSRLAWKIALVELMLIAALVAVAVANAGFSWWVPVAIAAPLVIVELWFDVRSRGRRLLPELCGAVGIAASVAVIVLAAGRSMALAVALWLVLAARSVGAIPFVRVQIFRLRRGATAPWSSDLAQAVSLVLAAVAVLIDRQLWFGAVALAVLAGVQVAWVRWAPVPAKVLGMRQMAMGFGLVAITAAGVWAL